MLRQLTLLATLVAVMSLAVAAVAYAETFVGTNGPDRIVGTDSSDTISGLGGADELRGRAGGDDIFGGRGGDTIYGGAGDDGRGAVAMTTVSGTCEDGGLQGGRGPDTVYAGGDDDCLESNAGADTLYGDDGDDDVLGADGVQGNDFVSGGSGFDVCVADSIDEIDQPTCEVTNL